MERDKKKEENSEALNSETIVRISAIDPDTNNNEKISKEQTSDNGCQILLLPHDLRGRKMQSFDLNGNKNTELINKIIKNSNSSSQLLLNSHKKMSFISKSRKNSRITNRSMFKKSNESIKSFSVQKPGVSLSNKMSHKKHLLTKISKDNLNISMFQNKFKASHSTKNMLGIKEIELKRAGQQTFGIKNYSNYEKKKLLLSGKNSSNVQSESNLKKSFGINLTEKFESNKKKKISKNESHGCLIEHRKKTSENFKQFTNQYLTINQKLMKRTKSHANHLEVNGMLGFSSINKKKAEKSRKGSNFIFEHKKVDSSHQLINKSSAHILLKKLSSQENNNGQDLNFIDKSIEADGDLYNEEHANLYQNNRKETCLYCEQILQEVVTNCNNCNYLLKVKEFSVSPMSFETCDKCVKKFLDCQTRCTCQQEHRERTITFGKSNVNLSKQDFVPRIGHSVKDLDQLEYIEESEELSIKLNKDLTKKNNTDDKKLNNPISHNNNIIYATHGQNQSINDNNIKPPLQLEYSSEFQKDYFKNNNLKRNKNQDVKNFFINSPGDVNKNFKFSHKSTQIKKVGNPYKIRSSGNGSSVLLTENSSPTWSRINSQNSSKLQLKINPQKNKSLRKGFTDFSKKNIVNSLHKKIKTKLNISNHTDLLDYDKKYSRNSKINDLKDIKYSLMTDVNKINGVDNSHREKSLNPFHNKNKYMKRNHTTKNLRQFEFQNNKLNNPGMSFFLDKHKNKQIVEFCKTKMNKKQNKKNFKISKDKMLKSSLLPNLAKLKKSKNLKNSQLESSKNLNISKKIKDSFFKSKNGKRIKNSLTKIQTPKNNLSLKRSLNPNILGDGTLHSLTKVSENEDEGEVEIIVESQQNKKMMRNGSKSLSTGNISMSNSPDKIQIDTSYRRAETLKRSVAVKELRMINHNKNKSQEIEYNENDEIFSDEEEYYPDRKTFSQSSTNFKNKYFTLNGSETNIEDISLNKSRKQCDNHSHLNSKSLNVSSRQKFSNGDLNNSFNGLCDSKPMMTVSQAIERNEYIHNIDIEKNNSFNERNFKNKFCLNSGGSIKNLDGLTSNTSKNSLAKKNISLMNSKDRKYEKIQKSKEFKIQKIKSGDTKLKPNYQKKLNKKDITNKVMNDKFLQQQNFKKIISQNIKLVDFKYNNQQEPLLSCKNGIKKQKKSNKNESESFNRIPYMKETRISLQKEKISHRDIDIHQPHLGSKEEFMEDKNIFKKKKNNKNKSKKDSNQGTLKLTTNFNEKFETAQNQMKMMRNKLFTKNSQMKHNWIKNIAGTKDLLTVPSKLRSTKSRKRFLDPKVVDKLHNKVKNFMPKNEEKRLKKPKKSKQKDEKKNYDSKTKLSNEQNQIDKDNSKKSVNKTTLSKTKSSARLLFMGRVNKQTFTKKNRKEKFIELKKLTNTHDIDRDKIKETEFQEYLPNYTKYEMLGKGSYAEVYLCHHKESNNLVAIKIYERYKLTDEIRAENLRNEIEILKALDHKNIIKMLDHIKGVNLEFIVMEKGPQRMLSEFVKQFSNGRLPNYESRVIFEKIVEAVLYLHKGDISHRDLKLQNILVDDSLTVKLIDFGFATPCTDQEKLNVFCGTYSYMAPELVSKIPYDGKATDVWSLGVVLYLMILGDYPFKGCDEAEITHNITNLNYYLPSNLDPSIIELFKSIFVVDPEKRISAEEILSCDWLLLDDGKSFDMKDNQSTIFMESTDYI